MPVKSSHTAHTHTSTRTRAIHRRRRFAVGSASLAVATAGLLGVTVAAIERGDPDAASAAARIDASVDAAGSATTDPDGWNVERERAGTYALTFPSAMDVAVESWSVPADVTLVPLTATSWLITFVAEDGPVDAEFSFHASPAE